MCCFVSIDEEWVCIFLSNGRNSGAIRGAFDESNILCNFDYLFGVNGFFFEFLQAKRLSGSNRSSGILTVTGGNFIQIPHNKTARELLTVNADGILRN